MLSGERGCTGRSEDETAQARRDRDGDEAEGPERMRVTTACSLGDTGESPENANRARSSAPGPARTDDGRSDARATKSAGPS